MIISTGQEHAVVEKLDEAEVLLQQRLRGLPRAHDVVMRFVLQGESEGWITKLGEGLGKADLARKLLEKCGLASARTRVMVIAGPSGVGKTTLASEISFCTYQDVVCLDTTAYLRGNREQRQAREHMQGFSPAERTDFTRLWDDIEKIRKLSARYVHRVPKFNILTGQGNGTGEKETRPIKCCDLLIVEGGWAMVPPHLTDLFVYFSAPDDLILAARLARDDRRGVDKKDTLWRFFGRHKHRLEYMAEALPPAAHCIVVRRMDNTYTLYQNNTPETEDLRGFIGTRIRAVLRHQTTSVPRVRATPSPGES